MEGKEKILTDKRLSSFFLLGIDFNKRISQSFFEILLSGQTEHVSRKFRMTESGKGKKKEHFQSIHISIQHLTDAL